MRRLGRLLAAPDQSLLPRILAAFVLVLASSSLVTLLLETRITRQQLGDQATAIFDGLGDVMEGRLQVEAARIGQSIATVAQAEFAHVVGNGPRGVPEEVGVTTLAAREVDTVAARTLSILRTADPALELAAVVDGLSGRLSPIGLAMRGTYDRPTEEEARALSSSARRTQRVVPLQTGGYAVAYVQAVRRGGPDVRLLVLGYPLVDSTAFRYRDDVGVDDVEIVVDGRVVASTTHHLGAGPSGDPSLGRVTQQLPDGRLIRYVTLGSDRPWDTPAHVGLVSDDPLAALDGALAQTRLLMVALLLVIGAGLAFALAQVMTRPLHSLTRTAAAIAGGDLERGFDVDRRDEIGRLAVALEQMRRGLRSQLLVIRRQADALQEAARRMVGVQDRERQRVAQDLHDGIQQQLVVLHMQIGTALQQVADDPGRSQEVTEQLAGSIDSLLDQLRSTGHDLFPAILRDLGLGPALFSLASRSTVPIEVSLEPDPFPRVEPAIEVNAYFLASEAVTNAIKHALADRLRVAVSADDAGLRVTVSDDGVGFDESGLQHRGGLVHMRDRVNALGGSLRLLTRPGEGTTVSAVFPRDREPQTDARSAAGPLEVEEDGGHAPVEVDLLSEPELAEDGVGVLLDGALRDRQLPGDRGVPPS